MKKFIIVFLFFISCISNKRVYPTDELMIQQKYKPVVVKNQKGLDGCDCLLVQNDTLILNPLNLPDSLKIDGLKLWIKYSYSQIPTVCMKGTTIKLAAVNYRK